MFGDSGIISNAEKSKEKSEIANEKEATEKATIAVIAQSKKGEVTVADMQEEMDNSIGNGVATAIDNGDTVAIKFNKSNRYYDVDSDGNVQGPIEIIVDLNPDVFDGNGTEDDPFIIMSIEDLVEFSTNINKYKS